MKKRLAKNQVALRKLLMLILGVQVVYVLLGYWRGISWAAGLCTVALEWACFIGLQKGAQPSYSGGELVSAGADLDVGWWQYFFDVIYITFFVQLGSLYTRWAYLAFLSIPAYAIWAGSSLLGALSQFRQPEQQQAGLSDGKQRVKYTRARR